MQVSTSDLFDAHPDKVQVCEIQFRSYGAKNTFFGECMTLTATEDHHPVVKVLESPGHGRVLVVDGQGSLRVGLLGDIAAERGLRNGWVGAIVFGAIRDSAALLGLDFGLRALGTTARRSFTATPGVLGHPIRFGSVLFTPGSWVYVDADAVVVSNSKL